VPELYTGAGAERRSFSRRGTPGKAYPSPSFSHPSVPERGQRPVGHRRHGVGGEARQGDRVLGAEEAAEHLGGGQPHLPVGMRGGGAEHHVVSGSGAGRERLVGGAPLRAGADGEDGGLERGARFGPSDPSQALQEGRPQILPLFQGALPEAQVRPYVNAATLTASNITFKSLFFKVTKVFR